jgi:hypothetical protein
MTRASSSALPGLEGAGEDKGAGGPLYQGVCETIRVLFPSAKDRGHVTKCACDECDGIAQGKARAAGTIAQARSIAASIDRVSGHRGGRQASGVQLAAMHEQLDKLLARLDPDGSSDEFAQLLQEMRDAEEAGRVGRTAASHTEE